jgi:hypothetical protein
MLGSRGVRLTTFAAAFALACAIGTILVLARAWALPPVAESNTLLSPVNAARLVPNDLRTLAVSLEPRAARATARQESTLGKALALERVVHTAVAPTHATCFGYATVMNALGRTLGLPTRVVFGGTGVSDFDMHATVSVWLEHSGRWAIVDPTFGGTFTRAGHSEPLGVIGLRDSLLEGWWDQVRWQPSAPDSRSPSSYYVNPVFLFRYIGVYASVDGRTLPVTLSDSTVLGPKGYEVSVRDFQGSPDENFKARRVPAHSEVSIALPPRYAIRQLWTGKATGQATLMVPKNAAVVVWASSGGAANGYSMTDTANGYLSPIITTNGRLHVTGHDLGTVRVYEAQRFPAASVRPSATAR